MKEVFSLTGRYKFKNEKYMNKLEKIFGIVGIVAIILKFINIPGSGLILTLALLFFAIYYYFGFAIFNNIRFRRIFKVSAYKYTNAKRIFGAIALGIAFSAIIVGILFKLQLWMGGTIQLVAGLILLALIFIIAFVSFTRSRDEFYIPLFKRMAVIGGLGLFLLLFPTNALIDIYYRDNPEYTEVMKEYMADPGNEELAKQLDEMRENMK